MAENEPLTPEKQLLKLIENPKQETLRLEEAKREGKKWFSPSALKGRLAFWKSFSAKEWFNFKRSAKTPYGVRHLNAALKFLIIFLTLFLVYSLVNMGVALKKASNLMLKPEKSAGLTPEESDSFKSLPYYLEKVSKRNMFSLIEAPKVEVEEAPPTPASEGDRTKDFSLVGISWSANPEAMIEDTKEKRTFFVKRGQALDNDTRVVTIFKDRVILNYKDKEFELR